MAGPHKIVAEAQLAVSGDKGKYPEFQGNVLTVETRDFWREPEVSPKNQGFHYNQNAETYMLVGEALELARAGGPLDGQLRERLGESLRVLLNATVNVGSAPGLSNENTFGSQIGAFLKSADLNTALSRPDKASLDGAINQIDGLLANAEGLGFVVSHRAAAAARSPRIWSPWRSGPFRPTRCWSLRAGVG